MIEEKVKDSGFAFAVFKQIDSDKYTLRQKLDAIRIVSHCPTLNSISKNELKTALAWVSEHVTAEEDEEVRK